MWMETAYGRQQRSRYRCGLTVRVSFALCPQHEQLRLLVGHILTDGFEVEPCMSLSTALSDTTKRRNASWAFVDGL